MIMEICEILAYGGAGGGEGRGGKKGHLEGTLWRSASLANERD
jgi:hypothetical protein